jgi:hypothetical protein
MTTTINLRKILHRKAWEMVSPHPTTSFGNGCSIVSDENAILPTSENCVYSMMGGGVGTLWNYSVENDGWLQVISGGPTPVNGPGTMLQFHPLGMWGGTKTQAALGGTTTTLISSRNLTRKLFGITVKAITGPGAGYTGTITDNTIGPNSVITVTPASSVAFTSATTFEIYSGTVWMMPSIASTTGTLYYYDRATNAWGTKATVTLAANLATHSKFVITPSLEATFDSGTASVSTTSNVVTVKNWLTNCWTNYQVKILTGTGAGQYRLITSNTATTLTVGTVWTTAPDATSTYEITGDDDAIYIVGNGGVNLYKYSMSANTWSAAMTVNVARSGTPGAGVTANWISKTSWVLPVAAAVRANSTVYSIGQIITPIGGTDVNSCWYECTTAGTSASSEPAVAGWRVIVGSTVTDGTAVFTRRLVPQNGRYIYSLRGNASGAIDIYDLVSATWYQNTSGTNFAYGNSGSETFTTGTSAVDGDGHIYIYKPADAGKILRFNVQTNTLEPWAIATYSTSTNYDGQKMFPAYFIDGGTKIRFLYFCMTSKVEMLRMMEIA